MSDSLKLTKLFHIEEGTGVCDNLPTDSIVNHMALAKAGIDNLQ